MNVNARKRCTGVYADLGSDGNNSVNSLISDDRTIRILNRELRANNPPWISHQTDTTMYEERIRDNATKRPDLIEWRPNSKKITVHRRGSSFGIEFKVKPIKDKFGTTLLYVVVKGVQRDSAAALANLQRGDLILSVNGHPTHYDERHSEGMQTVAEDDIENIIRESARNETMVLIAQSPSDMKKDENDNSCNQLSSINCRTNGMLQPADNHTHTRYPDTFNQTTTFQTLPYSKVLILGEDSTLLAKHLFEEDAFVGRDGNLHNDRGFQRISLTLKESNTFENGFTFRKCLRTYESWLKDVLFLDASGSHNGRSGSSMFVDVIAVSQEQAFRREAVASFFMSGNEVYVYQVSALRLQIEPEICMEELRSALNKIKSLAGHRVPVILAVTSKDPYVEPRCQDDIVNLVRRFVNDPQIVLFPNSSPCCFLSLHEGSECSSQSEFDSLLSSENDMSQQSVDELFCPSNLLRRLLRLVWEQEFLTASSPNFLASMKSFWKMVDSRRGHECFFKRDIQAVLRTKTDADVNDFVHFLTSQSQLLPAYPGSMQELFISPSFLLSPFLKLLQPPPLEKENRLLRNHWKRLATMGIASVKLLKEIFHELDMCSVLSSLRDLRLMWPLSHIAIESNGDLKRMFSSRDKLYFFPIALKPASDCKCIHDGYTHHLITKFEENIPPGFLEHTVFRLVEKLKNGPVRWKTSHRGCFEVTVGDGCVVLFKEDLTTASIRIYCSFHGSYRPKKLLQALRKTIEDIAMVGVDNPLLGCECPLKETCQENPSEQMHLIDLDGDYNESFFNCGQQSLKEHPAILFWLSDSNTEPRVRYSNLSESVSVAFHHEPAAANINVYSSCANPDDLSNLNPTIYRWLCKTLSVHSMCYLDWRTVACKLGYNRDDMDQFNKPEFFSCGSGELNPCKKLFQAWMSSGKSSIIGLISLLREVGREDIAYDMETKLKGSQ